MSPESEVVLPVTAEGAPGAEVEAAPSPEAAAPETAAAEAREAAAEARRGELRRELGIEPAEPSPMPHQTEAAAEQIKETAGRFAQAVKTFGLLIHRRDAAGYNADFEVADFQKIADGCNALEKIANEGGDVAAVDVELARITEGLSRMYAPQHGNINDDVESVATLYHALGGIREVAVAAHGLAAENLADISARLQAVTETRYEMLARYLNNRYR